MTSVAETSYMDTFASRANHSWIEQLSPDTEQAKHSPNKRMREVFSGHYVLVKPTPLPDPEKVIHSDSMALEFELDEEAINSETFLNFFSGNTDILPQFRIWATPYALSIYGQEMYDNCPFKTGNAYGDGRAIYIGEVLMPSGKRWDLQLKGAGTTPWCRGGDGRAVLRSSIREFLVSEAMHAMGVPTTRALSLVVSKTETVDRPWCVPRFDSSRVY